MEKIIKKAPLIIAVLSVIWIIIACIKPGNYRFEFIGVAFILAIMQTYYWSEERDREIKRSDNEQGPEPEPDNHN